MAKKVPAEVWLGRLAAAKEVWKRREPTAKWLQDSLAGKFPAYVPGPAWPRSGRLSLDGAEQINVNLNLRAANHYKALAYDEFPDLRWPNVGEGDTKVYTRISQLVERVMSGGDAVRECRSGITNVCTKGAWVMWVGYDQDLLDPARVAGASTPISVLVSKAAMGMPVSPLPGMDYLAVADTVRTLLVDPEQVVAMPPEIRENLIRLAQEADAMAQDEFDSGQSVTTRRGQVWYQHTPYGSRCLWDSSVWDMREIGWAARLIIMRKDEIADSPLFTAKAKKEIKSVEYTDNDGHAVVLSGRMSNTDLDEENSACRIWEIHDKRNRKRHLVSEGYDDYMEVSDVHPMLSRSTGQPLLPNFFPMVVRTPILSDEERPERTIGVPLLEPGIPHQIEAIKFHSAHALAAKKTARVIQIPAGLDEETKTDLALARDCAMIPVDATAGEKPIAQALNFGNAPVDYLAGALRATADFAKSVGISLGTLTGEPVADTLGQEELAMEGSNLYQRDIVSSLESGFAETALITLILVREFYTPEQIAELVGKDFVEPPRDAQGNPAGPSPWDLWRATSLDGDKIECVFASRARAEELAKNKQIMDLVALLDTKVDLNGLPKWETQPYIEDVAKRLGLGRLTKYEPTPEEKAMIALTIESGRAAQQGMERNGKRTDDSRIAGGQRGTPPVPGRQSRGRGPAQNGQIQNAAQRPATATA